MHQHTKQVSIIGISLLFIILFTINAEQAQADHISGGIDCTLPGNTGVICNHYFTPNFCCALPERVCNNEVWEVCEPWGACALGSIAVNTVPHDCSMMPSCAGCPPVGGGICGDFDVDPGEDCDHGFAGSSACTPSCEWACASTQGFVCHGSGDLYWRNQDCSESFALSCNGNGCWGVPGGAVGCNSPPPPPSCPDGSCNGGETCSSCSADCGVCPPPPPGCGDGSCNGGETCSTCSADCGVCPPPPPWCGDGSCNGGESCSTCSADCGACPPGCDGDYVCEAGETAGSCPSDCDGGSCNTASCSGWNNQACDGWSCVDQRHQSRSCSDPDCGSGDENRCVNDAACAPPPPSCDNDYICEAGETAGSCPNDCDGGSCNTASCSGWSNQACGAWTCNVDDRHQTRSCADPDCGGGDENRCINAASCETECNDGIDNDGDFDDDLADVGCAGDPYDDDETNCGDGVCEGPETVGSCAPDCVTCDSSCTNQANFFQCNGQTSEEYEYFCNGGQTGFCDTQIAVSTNCDIGDGWTCIGSDRENHDNYCNVGSGQCDVIVLAAENCATDPIYNSYDNNPDSGNAPGTYGTCQDYTGACVAGNCVSVAVADSCLDGDTVTETFASGLNCATSNVDCEYQDVAGTDPDGSPGNDPSQPDSTCTPGLIGSCGAGACGAVAAGGGGTDACQNAADCGTAGGCDYIEYHLTDLNGNGILESCTSSVHDPDSTGNAQACNTCAAASAGLGGIELKYGIPDHDGSPGLCCGDDQDENVHRFQWLKPVDESACETPAHNTQPLDGPFDGDLGGATPPTNEICEDSDDEACCLRVSDCVFGGQCYRSVDDIAREACGGGSASETCIKEALKNSRTDGVIQTNYQASYQDVLTGDSGRQEVCRSASPGVWGGTVGSIYGQITDFNSGLPIANVRVQAESTGFITFTDSNGDYVLVVDDDSTYNLVFSRSPYTNTVSGAILVGPFENVQHDDTMGVGPSECESDCTFASDNTCHPVCQGVNNCNFFDTTVMQLCNDQQKDFRFDYPGGEEVQCCTGVPYTPQEVPAEAEIDAANSVRVTRDVWYEGELIKLVIDVFD